MLSVRPLDEVKEFIINYFRGYVLTSEQVHMESASGRVLSEDVLSNEYVPGFTRSTVDGYAVCASDTFGCSDSIPALLSLKGEVTMGKPAGFSISKGECGYVPTGGAVPKGADAMVMIEYADVFPDGTIAINKPSAPGNGLIFTGDDVKPGKLVLKIGQRLKPKDIGTLAAMGVTSVDVFKKPKVAVISTGNELIPPDGIPNSGEIRDVDQSMLIASLCSAGAEAISFGIIKDEQTLLMQTVIKASEECDMVLISGGTSVGLRDATSIVIEQLGEILVHGLALKPGKPTLVGEIANKPVFGLPGHPVAAYFVFKLLVEPLLSAMTLTSECPIIVSSSIVSNFPSNHGREECVAVTLKDGQAIPISAKSGLITTLSGADGFIRIPRDCEGLKKNSRVDVILF